VTWKMLNYDPLFKTLEEKSIKQIELSRECKISSATIAKFRKNESVTLEVIDRICTFLEVPIEKVVKII
jgi:DNA-binding Xre family transcriptional regulator